MKGVFRFFTLALTVTISLAGIGAKAGTVSYKLSQIAQSLEFNRQERLLEVAIRESAIIRFKRGGSYTGKLTAFNSQNLTIELAGTSETIPLSQIEEIKFQGSIVFEGEITYPPIRGIKILPDLPITALDLANPPITASLSLKTMSSEGFARFSDNVNCPCTISKIILEGTEKMTLKLTEIP